MRRFSQRNSLVTLSDINITPLLDLAFVLLIIFVITTPLLEQGMNLKLPAGGREETRKLDPSDIRTIDISRQGQFKFKGRFQSVDQIAADLRKDQLNRPNLLVYIRADQAGLMKYFAAMLDRLEKVGIVNISVRTEPAK